MAAELLLDTGALVALLDSSEHRHAECARVFSTWRGSVLTTEAVVTEAAYLLSWAQTKGELALRFCVRGGAVVTPWTDSRAERAAELMNTYCDTPMDYADASLVALAEELGTPDVSHWM